MQGADLHAAADEMIRDYFDQNKLAGCTCDFGGIAMLVEEDAHIDDDDFVDWDVAYFGRGVKPGPNWWQMGLIIAFGVLFGTAAGFVIGMRYNKGFNRYVSQSSLGRRVTRSSNDLLKSALSISDLAGLDLDEMDQQPLNNGRYGAMGMKR